MSLVRDQARMGWRDTETGAFGSEEQTAMSSQQQYAQIKYQQLGGLAGLLDYINITTNGTSANTSAQLVYWDNSATSNPAKTPAPKSFDAFQWLRQRVEETCWREA